MKLHLKTVLTLCALALTTGVDADIMEAHIKALGGKEAIAKIKTITRSGTVNGEGEIERACVVGEKSYHSAGGWTLVWNGQSGWVKTGDDVRDANATEVATAQGWAAVNQALPLVALDEEGGMKPDGEKNFAGTACEAFTVAVAPGLTYYFDKESKMLVGMTGKAEFPDAGAFDFKVTFSDFQEHEGVKFHGKESTVITTADGDMSFTYEFTKTEINGEIEDSKFEKPE